MNPDTLQIVIIVLTVGFTVAAARVVGSVARRIGGRPTSGDTPTRAETDRLRDQVERLAGELGELQERVDFAERMLAKQRDAERLKG